MKRGLIPGVNVAPNTASMGYRRGETGLCVQVCWTLDIAPNTLPPTRYRRFSQTWGWHPDLERVNALGLHVAHEVHQIATVGFD